jgi:hypothetical protein
MMAEVLVEFSEPVYGEDGRGYAARACGAPMDDERWEGWIEFLPLDGSAPRRSARETTQPNRVDTLYWATGLTPVYLEGALKRTLRPFTPRPPGPAAKPVFDRPAASIASTASTPESVLNPFSAYRKGEALLRQQLGALSAWHLVNIVRHYGLSELPVHQLESMDTAQLADVIVASVRAQTGEPLVR